MTEVFGQGLFVNSFYSTYALLITTGAITLIEALRARTPKVRHVMNLETCVSVVAAFFYSLFLEKIRNALDQGQDPRELDLTPLRYLDWCITTPMMILVLLLVLSLEAKRDLTAQVLLTAFFLDLAMLAAGWAGERGLVSRFTGFILGLLAFALLFSYVARAVGLVSRVATIVFFAYTILWGLYGIAYMLDKEQKNVLYNCLDLIAKCFVGLFFWLYLAKIVIF